MSQSTIPAPSSSHTGRCAPGCEFTSFAIDEHPVYCSRVIGSSVPGHALVSSRQIKVSVAVGSRGPDAYGHVNAIQRVGRTAADESPVGPAGARNG